jgi:hypothetical protein
MHQVLDDRRLGACRDHHRERGEEPGYRARAA